MDLSGAAALKHTDINHKIGRVQFYPDSMLTRAVTFDLARDTLGRFPVLNSQDAEIKWLTREDEWLARNSAGKSFNMFANGTTLDGTLSLKPSQLRGSGIINMPDSRINSNLFTFTSNSIKADSADYNLKSPSTSGYAFIAEDANTNIDFNSS
jgi:hypothetical protein